MEVLDCVIILHTAMEATSLMRKKYEVRISYVEFKDW